MKLRSNEHRLNLRLPKVTFRAVDELRYEGIGKLSCNAWVELAIREKIDRDSYRSATRLASNDPAGRTFYEFFAGGGMARCGLGEGWQCTFANDFDPMKARVYRDNWNGGSELVVEDVNKITTRQLPGVADLVWASFPCQDLSLAGSYRGIGNSDDKKQTRSGTFWPFWKLISNLCAEGRAPKVVVLENVLGVLTSNCGKDFEAIASAIVAAGYKLGALVIDAKHFVPQSRPRVFIVCVRTGLAVEPDLVAKYAVAPWHVEALRSAHATLPLQVQRNWLWWALPSPSKRETKFIDLVEADPTGVAWHSSAETKQLLAMMSPSHLQKVEAAQELGEKIVGGVYRRTRLDEQGKKIQRAEVRFDDLAGCLRTPSGGSSRQMILLIEGKRVHSRLLSAREAARLMGLPDSYKLPTNYNDAYHVAGDGLVVPAVRHLADHLLTPLIESNRPQTVLPLKVASRA